MGSHRKALRILAMMRILSKAPTGPNALRVNNAQIDFSDTAQVDQEMGEANLHDSDATPFTSTPPDNSSIRMLILGDDQWRRWTSRRARTADPRGARSAGHSLCRPAHW